MNKTNFKPALLSLFFLVLLLPFVFAVNYNGDTATSAGNYTGNTAVGTFVERQANSSDNSVSSIIFGWSGPVVNGTSESSISGFGISSSSDFYTVTFGPELEDATSEAALAEEETPEEPSSSIPSSNGGGGGSSHRDTYGLTTGDILTIIIAGETHTITIDAVRDDSATITIESIPQTIDLTVGETKELDITNAYSGTDVTITLDAVSDLRRITITIEDLTQEQTEEETAPEETTQEPQENPELLETITGAVAAIRTPQVQETAKEVKQGITTLTKWIILTNIAIGIIVGLGIAAKKQQQKRIYTVFHQKTKQELIADELKKVEGYVKQAMQQRYRYEGIKEQLLTAGWQEYEVDEVIVNAMLAEKQQI